MRNSNSFLLFCRNRISSFIRIIISLIIIKSTINKHLIYIRVSPKARSHFESRIKIHLGFLLASELLRQISTWHYSLEKSEQRLQIDCWWVCRIAGQKLRGIFQYRYASTWYLHLPSRYHCCRSLSSCPLCRLPHRFRNKTLPKVSCL